MYAPLVAARIQNYAVFTYSEFLEALSQITSFTEKGSELPLVEKCGFFPIQNQLLGQIVPHSSTFPSPLGARGAKLHSGVEICDCLIQPEYLESDLCKQDPKTQLCLV